MSAYTFDEQGNLILYSKNNGHNSFEKLGTESNTITTSPVADKPKDISDEFYGLVQRFGGKTYLLFDDVIKVRNSADKVEGEIRDKWYAFCFNLAVGKRPAFVILRIAEFEGKNTASKFEEASYNKYRIFDKLRYKGIEGNEVEPYVLYFTFNDFGALNPIIFIQYALPGARVIKESKKVFTAIEAYKVWPSNDWVQRALPVMSLYKGAENNITTRGRQEKLPSGDYMNVFTQKLLQWLSAVNGQEA